MDNATLLRVIRGRLWLVGAIALVTATVLGLRLGASDSTHRAEVKLQLTAPEQEEVVLYDRYRSVSVRDELAVARNNFIEVLRSRAVRARTASELGLEKGDFAYGLDVTPLRDSDFVYVSVEARTPELAQDIAAAHVAAAIEYYGEVRAKPAVAARDFIAEQLDVAAAKVSSAEEALNALKQEHGIASLDGAISANQSLLQGLTLERSKLVAQGAGPNSVGAMDGLIESLRLERERLIAIAPRYAALEKEVAAARAQYDFLQKKYSEASLKVNSVQLANFIQVVEPPLASAGRSAGWAALLFTLGLAGSIGLGMAAALLLEHLAGASARRLDAAVGAVFTCPIRAAGALAADAFHGLAALFSSRRDRGLRTDDVKR